MMQGVTESLACSVVILNLIGFSQKERHQLQGSATPFLPDANIVATKVSEPNIKDVFLDIWTGSIPIPANDKDVDINIFFNSYLQTYLQSAVSGLTQVGNPHQFTHFVRTCAERTGRLFNYSDLARDADISGINIG